MRELYLFIAGKYKIISRQGIKKEKKKKERFQKFEIKF
jgi:hypothetical protein